MNHLGYCVTKNGQPVGICPVSLFTATRTLERYKARDEFSNDYQIVPIYAGAAVSPDKLKIPEPA
jgi:hypothetical protein